MSFRVFINYRREDASGHAGRLYDSLRSRFTDDQLFMDIDTIEPGLDFTEVIDEAVQSCDAVIALIGRRWTSATDATGRRRLENSSDYVRLEIEAALRRNVRVIPVLVGGAEVPRPDDLPESLEKLTRLNALEMSDGRWQFDLGRLIKVLDRLEQQAREREQALAEGQAAPAGPPQAEVEAAVATIAVPAQAVETPAQRVDVTAQTVDLPTRQPARPAPPPPSPAAPTPPARPTRPSPRPVPPARRRALLLGAGVGGVAVAALLAVVLTRDGTPGPAGRETPATAPATGEPTTGPAPTSPPPTSVPPTTPPLDPARLAWARVPPDPAVFGGLGQQVINRMVVFGSGLVAVGFEDPGGDSDGAVWTSPDGETWRRRTVPVMGGPGEQVVGGVAGDGAALVAVGSDGEGDARDAAVWLSRDGVDWSRVDRSDPALDLPGDQAMRRVAAAGPGFVAVGYDGGDAAVWTFDGTTWSRVVHESFGGSGDQQMWSVTGFGSEGIVAVGTTDSPSGDLDAAVWSFDGSGWRMADGPFGGAGDQQMTMVIASEDGLVAAGFDGPPGQYDAAVWTSPDGLNWSRAEGGAGVFGGPGDQEIVGLAALDLGLVAVGFDRSVDSANPAVWTSPDGAEWTRSPTEQLNEVGDQRMKTVAVLGARVVALGRESLGTDVDAAAWVAEADG